VLYEPTKPSGDFTIDATRYGNVARFLTTACDANLSVTAVFAEHRAPLAALDSTEDVLRPLPRLVFVAKRDILAGEDLTFGHSPRSQSSFYPFFPSPPHSVDPHSRPRNPKHHLIPTHATGTALIGLPTREPRGTGNAFTCACEVEM
jgi:hypothetical protein